jgi:hypothetical protein
MNINWNDLEAPVSKYFKVKEALYLPKFNIYHTPSPEEMYNIWFLSSKLDKVHEFIGRKMAVHCWIRPVSINCPGDTHHRMNYNQLVGGAQNSAHIYGNACDFNFEGKAAAEECQEMRLLLVPELERLGLRMENKEGAWLHMDRNKVPSGGNYYFIP